MSIPCNNCGVKYSEYKKVESASKILQAAVEKIKLTASIRDNRACHTIAIRALKEIDKLKD